MPGCKHKADGFRGMCNSCYRSLWRMVKLNRAKWVDFESKGWCTPDRRKELCAKPRTAAGKLAVGSK